MEILDILRRESEVSSMAYLYEEEGRWYAYENSAYLISTLLKKFDSIERVIHDAFLTLIRIEIVLEFDVLAGCNIISCSDTELKISFASSLEKVA